MPRRHVLSEAILNTLPISIGSDGWYFWQEIYLEGNTKTINSLLFEKEKIGTLVTLQSNFGCSSSNSSHSHVMLCIPKKGKKLLTSCRTALKSSLSQGGEPQRPLCGLTQAFPGLLRGVTAEWSQMLYILLDTGPVLGLTCTTTCTVHTAQIPFLGLAQVHSG